MPTISWVKRHLQASRMFRPPELPQASELSSTHFEDRSIGERGVYQDLICVGPS